MLCVHFAFVSWLDLAGLGTVPEFAVSELLDDPAPNDVEHDGIDVMDVAPFALGSPQRVDAVDDTPFALGSQRRVADVGASLVGLGIAESIAVAAADAEASCFSLGPRESVAVRRPLAALDASVWSDLGIDLAPGRVDDVPPELDAVQHVGRRLSCFRDGTRCVTGLFQQHGTCFRIACNLSRHEARTLRGVIRSDVYSFASTARSGPNR